ncbi:APC family permease [Luteibacter aegosomatis]|uniref:APC family permease n=1 Tax=Luteibacter aegosomatis TaxID=2911537 RepID=UPI001FF77FA9|nr:APC family permease [Luteibacter aegosomatis]UPG86785.1 APC family permease [Luteibacter aegosomatis]
MSRSDAPSTRTHKLSTRFIVFMVLAAAAPLASMIGNLPIAISRGTGAHVPVAFLIAGSILVAFTVGYAFIGRRVVSTGAFYTYVAEGLGKPLGVGTAYSAIVSYGAFTFGLAAACGYFDEQVSIALGHKVNWTVFAVLSAVVVGILNYRSMDASTKLLAAIIIVETAVLVVFDVSVVAARGWAAFPLSSFTPGQWLAPGIGVSLMTAFTCFVGFESGALYSKEAADPVRSIPLASYVSVILIGSFYLVTAWITVGALSPGDVKAQAVAHGGTLMLDLIKQYDGETASDVAGLLLCTSMLATYIAIHAAASRYIFALAREGLLPRRLARFDETRNVPVTATLCMSAATALCLIAIASSSTDPYAAIIPVLIGLGTLGIIGLQATAAIAIAFYVFRRAREAGPIVMVASVCAAIGLSVALTTVCVNFTLLSTVDTPFVALLPLSYVATLFGGLAYSMWLRQARPAQYRELALVEHRATA